MPGSRWPRRLAGSRRHAAAPKQIRIGTATRPRSTRRRSRLRRQRPLVRDRHAQPHAQGRWYRRRPSLLTCPALRRRLVDFFDGGNLLRPAREQADKAGYRPCGPGRLEHAPTIWQQVQFDLVAWPDAEVLQYVLPKRHLSPCGNGQCGHGGLPSQSKVDALHFNAKSPYFQCPSNDH
ncbi:hypothetical protein XHV734_p0014 (plasmid) [Xanthomonas hortorum pv. vitians]|nr:hypothetical protein XHV734_p0014 [Xanthomonas hortorum pv. vitians]